MKRQPTHRDGTGVPRAEADALRTSRAPQSMRRRELLVGAMAAIGGTALLGFGRQTFAAGSDPEIRIGYISPRSGNLGSFGESDPYVLDLVRKTLFKGLHSHGTTYRITILDRDSQSSPSRASQLAQRLISEDHIHLMLTTATPETVNPVSDACEAAGVPSVANDCPLESFFFGRGGKLGHPSPFKWTFDFSFGIEQFAECYLSIRSQLKTNKKVAVLYPNDADGNAFREHLEPFMKKHGYTVIDPGPYQDGTTDYTSQIALFNRENCQIFSSVGLPNDVNTFWRQAAQLGYAQKAIIVTNTKGSTAGILPLGPLAYNMTGARFWLPVYPYVSPLTGQTSQQLADGYEKATGRQWLDTLGAPLSLFEVAASVLKAARDPTARDVIRDEIKRVDMITTLGRIDFKGGGPYPNTAVTPMIGGQWVKAAPGSKYPLDEVSIEHQGDPNVPVQRKLAPYHI